MKLNLGNRIFMAVIDAIIKVLYHPVVHYEGEEWGKDGTDFPAIIIANHTGHLDGPVMSSALGIYERLHCLAAKDRFDDKWFGFWLRHTNCIPIDRENPNISWIHDSMRLLKADKECVAIFPEGRHGRRREQLPFHSGVTLLAVMAGEPVILVYIDGPLRIFHSSHIMVGKPFRVRDSEEGISPEFVKEQTELFQNGMKDLMNEYIRISDGR